MYYVSLSLYYDNEHIGLLGRNKNDTSRFSHICILYKFVQNQDFYANTLTNNKILNNSIFLLEVPIHDKDTKLFFSSHTP